MKTNNNENIVSTVDLGNLIRDNSPEGIRTRGCFEGCLMQKIGLVRTVWFYLIKSSTENLSGKHKALLETKIGTKSASLIGYFA